MPLAGHWLEVWGGVDEHDRRWREAEMHHPADCPTQVYVSGIEGREAVEHLCAVGRLVSDVGLEELLRRPLEAVGDGGARRRLDPWALGSVTGWYRVEEWNAGLEILEGPYPGPPGSLRYVLSVPLRVGLRAIEGVQAALRRRGFA